MLFLVYGSQYLPSASTSFHKSGGFCFQFHKMENITICIDMRVENLVQWWIKIYNTIRWNVNFFQLDVFPRICRDVVGGSNRRSREKCKGRGISPYANFIIFFLHRGKVERGENLLIVHESFFKLFALQFSSGICLAGGGMEMKVSTVFKFLFSVLFLLLTLFLVVCRSFLPPLSCERMKKFNCFFCLLPWLRIHYFVVNLILLLLFFLLFLLSNSQHFHLKIRKVRREQMEEARKRAGKKFSESCGKWDKQNSIKFGETRRL